MSLQVSLGLSHRKAGYTQTILALYPVQKEFDELLETDAARFRQAVLATGAALSLTEPVYALAGAFERQLDLTQTAAEVGVTAKDFLAGLERSPALARVFGPLKEKGGTIQRDVLVEHFGDLAKVVLADSKHIPAVKIDDPDYLLGVRLWEGRGEGHDRSAAREAFQKAAKRGHVLAQAWLANDQWNGLLGSSVDEAEGAKLYRLLLPDLKSLADRGIPDAQDHYGFVYWEGIGVPKDEKLGADWIRRAAEQGAPGSQRMLGDIYQSGRGVPKNDEEGVRWYRKAADQNYVFGQFFLGLSYWTGNGVAKNDDEAVRWFRKAAEQKLAAGQNFLGLAYEGGRGVQKNHDQAVDWYRRSAEQDYGWGLANLGVHYYSGEGVSKNHDEAVRLLRKAARNSDVGAAKYARDQLKALNLSE